MTSRLDISWTPPGPVAAQFVASRATVDIINGPVGSGKTTAAMMKLLALASEQTPSRSLKGRDGRGRSLPLRQFRVAVVRDTYRQLWRTTLPSWWQRVPRDLGEFQGGEGAPAIHRIRFALPDLTMVEFQADFVAIGEQTAEDALRGYEVTGFYLNEFDLMAEEVFEYAVTRIGRWPPASDIAASWAGIIADCNAPRLDNWVYQRLFKASAEALAEADMALWRQPGGLDPRAENLENLPPGYYQTMARTLPGHMCRRMVDNVPGYSRSGHPVYPEFSDTLHVAGAALQPVRGRMLNVGLDAGLNPAAVFAQQLATGQWLILAELIGEPGTGATRFGQQLARFLRERFDAWPADAITGWADPSAAYGQDRRAGERSWIDIVARQARIRVRPAPSNALTPRLEAVRLPLTRMVDGAPGFLLSPACPVLRAGLNAEYRFRRMNTPDERYDEVPDKNAASHPQDALQYALLGGGEQAEIRRRAGEDRHRQMRQPQVLSTEFSF